MNDGYRGPSVGDSPVSGYVRSSLRGKRGQLRTFVQAGFGAPERQSRWKIGFRLILAIPIDLWLFVLSVWGFILIIVGWFCALVLGRLPFAIAQYLSNLIVRQTRANSYAFLMNDAYPPFSAKADFGVNVMIPITKVRRWAVLFRYILLLPAGLVQGVVTVGLSICSIFIWLIVLVKGEMPLSLFGAIAAVLRFQARTSAYALMLTGKYPGELFGEKSLETEEPSDASGVRCFAGTLNAASCRLRRTSSTHRRRNLR